MIHKIISTLIPAAILLAVFALPGHSATLTGTLVTGSLTFAGDLSNYFDPGYGFVPATGYLNASGTTVTVSDRDVEFGFDDGSSLISADFSGNLLTVSDLIESSGPTNGFQVSFTDSAFSGQYLNQVADNFPTYSDSIAGDVLTLNYAGGNPTAGQTFAASFTLAPVPEPCAAGLVSLAVLAGLAILVRRQAVRSNKG